MKSVHFCQDLNSDSHKYHSKQVERKAQYLKVIIHRSDGRKGTFHISEEIHLWVLKIYIKIYLILNYERNNIKLQNQQENFQ